jgi:hypothetical protein
MSRSEKVRECIDNGSKLANRDLIATIDDVAKRKALGLTTEKFEFVVEVEQFVEATIANLEKISRKLWSLPDDFECHYALNYRDSPHGRSNAGSRSGKWRSNYEIENKAPGDCINLNSLWSCMRGPVFEEYSHVAADPQIGTIDVASWHAYVEVLLCHEFAHILEKYVVCDGDFPRHIPKKCKGHEFNWQCIYRWLRIKTGHVLTKSTKTETIENIILRSAPVCMFCGQPFTAKRSDAKFCSTKCRVYASRRVG